eukprot:Em0026g34a
MHHVVVGLTWLKKRLAALGLKRRNVVETRLTLVHQAIKGPNWCWHIDGCDKLKPFGFPIHACIDGFSWKIIWLELTATNNDPDVVVKFYLDAVVKLEGPIACSPQKDTCGLCAGRTIIVSDSFVCISQQREVPASPTIVLNWICAYSDSHVVVKQ